MELPRILFKNKWYTFDYRLSELRVTTKKGIRSINLNNTELELLDYAIKNKDKHLILSNMKDLEYKL
jgi:hypothetical protein